MSIEEAIAEMSGVRICAKPGCQRVHAPGQGTRTDVGQAKILTCFGPCAAWALEEQRKAALS